MSWIPFALMAGERLLSGGDKQTQTSPAQKPLAVNPWQNEALKSILAQYMGGGGEVGFGSAARQGRATLGRAMAGRGISPDSGVYQSALGQMLGQYAAADEQNRRNFGLNLVTAAPPLYSRGGQTTVQQGRGYGDRIGGAAGDIGTMMLLRDMGVFK